MIRRFDSPTPPHGVTPPTGMLIRMPRFEVNLPV